MVKVCSPGSVPELQAPKLVCSHPYMALGGLVPSRCGQCTSCRVTRMRKVVLRSELELRLHRDASVVTLTYADEFVGDGNVRKDEWKKVKERLYVAYRRATGVKLRFHGIGEYGGLNGRPHWHVVAFGLPVRDAQEYWEKAWIDPASGKSLGHIKVDKVDLAVLRYVAGYCMSKLTRPDDPWLEGRAPEFAIRPNRPGLGLGYVDSFIESILSSPGGLAAVKQMGDVPAEVRLGKGVVALDKLFKQKVRVGVFGEAQAEQILRARKDQYVGQSAEGRKQFGRVWAFGGPARAAVRVLQREKRLKLFSSKKSL